MSKNLVKQIFTIAPGEEEKRIIDSNELMKKRMEALSKENSRFKTGEFVSGLGNLEVVELPENTEEAEDAGLIKADEEAESILERAKTEAEDILAQARTQAERVVQDAKVQAESQKNQIISQARDQGYGEGMEKARVHEAAMEQEYQKRLQQLEDEYQHQIDVLEPEFVNTITGIYEHVFHADLSSHREVLNYLISATIRKQEDSRSFMIHVSQEDYAYVNMQKKQMLAGAVSESANVDVVEDLTLGKNECMIETENGIFDCGLGTQLSELKRKLMLLAWSGDTEQ